MKFLPPFISEFLPDKYTRTSQMGCFKDCVWM